MYHPYVDVSAAMSLEGAETVRVKEEPEWESEVATRAGLHAEHEVENEPKCETDAQGVKEEHQWESEVARTGLHTQNVQEDELESKAGARAGDIKHEVKEEASKEGACGVSAAAARAGLYTDHTVKEELVVGPKELHRPKMVLVHPGFRRTCSVRLERMHVDSKRRTCKIGPRTYKFRLCLNIAQGNSTRKQANSSKNKFSCRFLKAHEKSHTGEKPYKCAYCDYSSGHKFHLKFHISTHTGEKPYKCGHCSFSTAQKSNLQVHIRTQHTGQKPYKCSVCSFASAYKHHLRAHEMIHTGEKPYKCGHCSYSTAEKSSLPGHIRTHTGEKPYKCAVCSFASAYSHHLRTHERTHTGEKPYKCGRCSFKTARKGNLTAHEKAHTGERPYNFT